MEDYSIHQLKPEDFDILIPLMKDCFGMSVDPEYFRWKFLQNPAGPVVGFYALSDSGECAAYYGAIAENYIIDGVSRKIYQSCDTMTHSKHRRKGLFQRLATTCYEFLESQDALFIIGFGGGQSTPGFLKFGWKHCFDVFFHFKPALFCRLEILLNKVKQLISKSNYTVTGVPDVAAVSHLLNGNKESSTIALNRSTAFINWKLKNPMHNCQMLGVKNSIGFTGYCIYYIELNKLMLIDACCGTQGQGKNELFYALNKVVTDNGLTGIVTFAQRKTTFSKLLLSSGFLINTLSRGPLHEHLPFIFYAGKPELEKYNNPEYWSITALDHDAF